MSEYLLAIIGDALHAANWQRAGNKRRPYPKPIPRPGSNASRGRTQLTRREIEARLRRLHRRDAERRGKR